MRNGFDDDETIGTDARDAVAEAAARGRIDARCARLDATRSGDVSTVVAAMMLSRGRETSTRRFLSTNRGRGSDYSTTRRPAKGPQKG